jgi:hypothetical protein
MLSIKVSAANCPAILLIESKDISLMEELGTEVARIDDRVIAVLTPPSVTRRKLVHNFVAFPLPSMTIRMNR